MKRLIKKSESVSLPMGILFKDYQDKIIDKDKIEDITYNSSISKEWLFDKPIDNPEWFLRSSILKK